MASIREIRFVVTARNPQWQFSKVTLAPGESATVSATGRWGVINPAKHGLTGPGGVANPARRGFYKPDAPEGCLLVLTGNGGVLHFKSDTDSLTVREPGPIYFVANDDRTPDLPLERGFDDNIGSMNVTIRIK
ncbi:MAG TPA: hypothetical protein VMH23_14800 [Bacteroidota bacterium]|nr:hypothetical protein [Bacteroidota bacterium]